MVMAVSVADGKTAYTFDRQCQACLHIVVTKEEAITWAGGVTRLAERLGIKPQAISQWRKRRPIPKLREYQIREQQQIGG
jgi:hypothetical protein